MKKKAAFQTHLCVLGRGREDEGRETYAGKVHLLVWKQSCPAQAIREMAFHKLVKNKILPCPLLLLRRKIIAECLYLWICQTGKYIFHISKAISPTLLPLLGV